MKYITHDPQKDAQWPICIRLPNGCWGWLQMHEAKALLVELRRVVPEDDRGQK
jgi:hypothetical protein